VTAPIEVDLDRDPRVAAGPERLLAGWIATGAPAGIGAHLARYGPPPSAELLISDVEQAGLRGRGGAGFPTARKLAAVAGGRRGRRVVVANGCEGDPVSHKDTVLMEIAPHLVLDGIVLAARAVGAAEAVLCVHQGSLAARRMPAAVRQRRRDHLAIRVVEVPTRYVASEESALVAFLTTGDARPTVTPPRPAERGVRGRPTLVDNVETLAQLALVARYGPEWYRAAGTRDSPGTTLVTVGGAVRWPGVYEVALGTPLGAVLGIAGGAEESLRAVQVGGLGGSWLAFPDAADVPLTHEDLRAAGATLGVAALVAVPERACGIAEAARVLRHLADGSAGQCGPCMFGLPALADDLALLADGRDGAALRRMRTRLSVVAGRGACAHPDGAVRFAASTLAVFAADAEEHAAGRPCRWARRSAWVPVRSGR
jgi:NADH:ubiquinone oxidoreductase subunit F (NADH-binding)